MLTGMCTFLGKDIAKRIITKEDDDWELIIYSMFILNTDYTVRFLKTHPQTQ